jgi:predicted ATPase/class 3 adenylate cyclase
MICSGCRTANPVQARFCMQCGLCLVNGRVCQTCHTLLPLHACYCYHCGTMVIANATAVAQMVAPQMVTPVQPMTAPPIPAEPEEPTTAVTAAARPLTDMLDSLRRYLPQPLFEPLERRPNPRDLNNARDHLSDLLATAKTYLPQPVIANPQPAGQPAGGMRQGAFLFVDVSGFTPLSERLSKYGRAGAEQVTAIINSLFHELVGILFQHGGSLLKFGGDALLGLFPANDEAEMAAGALHATQAAVAMQAVMEKFAAIEAAGETSALRIKCGLSAGQFFAAQIGTTSQMAFITTGHTVNRAEQAEGCAQPGDIILAESAYQLISDQLTATARAEGFYLLEAAPPAADQLPPPNLAESIEGDVQRQLAYLVERLDRLTPYLPAELLARMVTNPGNVQMPPDHRPVTVMFANYVGISDLIEDMGDSHPELITRHLNDYFVHMANIVERYEGTLGRMDQYSVGDRLVIFFGAPRVHEDDPVRAVYTALEMQAATRQHFAALQTPQGVYRFRQRIGINAGHLFAGNVGAANLRQEYTLMGDDINMAARLMSQAGWGEIFISKKCQERVSAFFELADKGSLKVKGKEILIPTFQVMGRREEIGRTRGLGSGDTPLVNRQAALAAVQKSGRTFLNGRSQILAVIGNSGLGKSRLSREFKQWLAKESDGREIRWLEAQALSFSEQVSYWIVHQLLYSALGLKAGANPDDILFNLWEESEALLGKETAREAAPFLANLIGLELEGEWAQLVAELDPQVRQKQTFWAAREFFAAFARRQPTIIFVDDLHWADEASLALLENLLAIVDNAPLLFYFIFRERRDKGCWRLRDKADSAYTHRYTQVELEPLTAAESDQLLNLLLPGANFNPQERQSILDKAAGNPFYLEEVARSLIEGEGVAPDERNPDEWRVTSKFAQINVPDTLQGAILARIDRLTEDARQALQMAAVIGRRFELDSLRSLAGEEAHMDAWLSQLERSDLIRPAVQDTAQAIETAVPIYSFPDALVQEVAYDSLLVQRRQEFHRRMGELMEKIFAERLEQECELLAYHFGRSDDREKAIHYLKLAARKAQQEFANETAVQHYTDLLDRMGGADDLWQERFDILHQRQKLHGLLGLPAAREDDIHLMMALASAHKDEQRRAIALNNMADLYLWTSRYEPAEKAAKESLSITRQAEDWVAQSEALHQLGVAHYYRGDYGQARSELEHAAALRETTGDAEGEAWSQMYLCMIHLMRGNFGDAIRHNQHALKSAETRQDWFQMGIHLTNGARIYHRMGEYEIALNQFQKSLEMKTRVGDRMGQGFTLFGMGLVYIGMGKYEEAELSLRASLELRRQIKDERGVSYCLHGLGLVSLAQNLHSQAQDYLDRAYQARSRLGLKAEMIADLSFLAQAYLGLEQLEKARDLSQQAIDLLAEQGNVEDLPQIYLNHYRVLKASGETTAVNYLHQAHEAMIQQANQIEDAETRETFLEKARVNREIRKAMSEK